MISVVMPAHNEEKVIGRSLRALTEGSLPGELEIVVVCNGCSDRTADCAREFGMPVRVAEIEKASKSAALNAGDRMVSGYPRLYVDADVVLPVSSVRTLAAALQNSHVLLAAPMPVTDTSQSSAAVRAYYAVWLSLPYNRVMVGTGAYALSERGRTRFIYFPPVIADDGFVRSRFLPEERIAVTEAPVGVTAPHTLTDLVRVKTRSRLGRYEVAAKFPRRNDPDPKRFREILATLPWGPLLPWRLFVYLYVNLCTRVYAGRRFRVENFNWDRDERSRE
jgi:glycosyltransferase involved in cell wall biosynthesis